MKENMNDLSILLSETKSPEYGDETQDRYMGVFNLKSFAQYDEKFWEYVVKTRHNKDIFKIGWDIRVMYNEESVE